MVIKSEPHTTDEGVPLTRREPSSSLEQDRLVEPFPLRAQRRPWLLRTLFACSVFLNAFLVLKLSLSNQEAQKTGYAGLARDVPVAFQAHSEYGLGSKSDSERSVLWENLDTSAGEISIANDEARALGLPESTPFFWDESRSTYLLNAHHSLHCLRKVRRSVTLSHHNGTQLDPYPHLVHCLDHLLQNVRCEADDTPMYTASYAPDVPTGAGQTRMCRSWTALDAWARRRPACFAYVNETQGVHEQLQRFRYCPRGSSFLGRMRAYFGYTEDWWEPAPEDGDTIPRYWESFMDEDLEY